jgi:hypothetical protein
MDGFTPGSSFDKEIAMKRLWIFCCLFLLSMGQAYAAGILYPGQGLSAGQTISSNNGQYYATMQTDGNFVVYTAAGTALWSTQTSGSTADWAVMQSDGNFVLYNQATGKAVWSSNTTYKRAGFAAITNYGQWIVFSNVPLWSSKTADGSNPPPGDNVYFGQGAALTRNTSYTAGQYTLIFQTDGNVVIYNPTKAIWSTNTSNEGASYAGFYASGVFYVMTGDQMAEAQEGMGYSTLFGTTEVAPSTYSISEWNSTYGAMQADGNFVIYIPVREFSSPSPYAPAEVYSSNAIGCYGPPDACMGTANITYPLD